MNELHVQCNHYSKLPEHTLGVTFLVASQYQN